MIGCGSIAKLHLNALLSIKDIPVKVEGLVDPVYESALNLNNQFSLGLAEECKVSLYSFTKIKNIFLYYYRYSVISIV